MFIKMIRFQAIFCAFVVLVLQAKAQTEFETAGQYLSFMNTRQEEILKNFMSYTSAVAHNKSARKVEGKRKEVISKLVTAKNEIARMPAFKGDESLRDSMVTYLEMSYHLFNDDYGKIVDLEEVAEQSYDMMEAYYKAQDLASERLENANKFIAEQQKSFAKRHNVNLIETKDEFAKKLEITNKVNEYYRQLFLIMFKCSNQEKYLIEALNKKDLNAVEQSKNQLLQFTEENLKKLATIKSFNNDNTLLNACRQLLLFYQAECKTQMPVMVDFMVKEDNFQKIKKAFDMKSESERTQTDVDIYNKSVNEMNEGVQKYNTTNKQLNEKRNTLLNNWNNTSKKFLDTHVPKY